MKQRISLTESQLHKVIKESVKKVLREGRPKNAKDEDFNEYEDATNGMDFDTYRTLRDYDKHFQLRHYSWRHPYIDSYNLYANRDGSLYRQSEMDRDFRTNTMPNNSNVDSILNSHRWDMNQIDNGSHFRDNYIAGDDYVGKRY